MKMNFKKYCIFYHDNTINRLQAISSILIRVLFSFPTFFSFFNESCFVILHSNQVSLYCYCYFEPILNYYYN